MKQKSSLEENKEDWLEQPNLMFPKELADEFSSDTISLLSKPLMVVDTTDFQGAGTWFKPTSLDDLLLLLQEFGGPTSTGGGYKIVVGNTEVGIGKLLISFSFCFFL